MHEIPSATRKSGHSTLPEGEEFYRHLAFNSLGLLCCHDMNGVLIWINSAAAESLGYTPEDGVGRNLREFLTPEVRPLFKHYLQKIRANGYDSGYMRLLARDGTERVWMYRNVVDPTGDAADRVLGLALDVTERILMEKSLQRSEERYRRLFEDAPVAYVELELNGQIRRVNHATCALFGLEPSRLVGTSLAALSAAGDIRINAGSLADPVQEIKPFVQRFISSRGNELDLEIHAKPIMGESGANAGFHCALLDMTERLHAHEQIRLLNAELEERVAARTLELERSNSELRQFAHVVSHDLQAPLQQVRALLEDALKTHTLEPVGSSFNLVHRSLDILDRMSKLIDGLLSYSVSSGAGRQPVRPVDSGAILAQTLLHLQSTIADSGAQVTHDEMPAVMMDPADLMRVFQNLLTNALKYSGSAPSVIHIAARQRENEWVFSIKDNGIGIAPEYAQNIFLPFRRLHGSEYPGSGIGLAVCKKIVERNGGRIWVESQQNQGATFYFTVPI